MHESVYPKRSLVVGLMAAVLLFASGCSPVTIDTKGEELPEGMLTEKAPDLSNRPDGLAKDFLKCIQKGQYAKAYDYFGAEARGQISRDSFVSTMSNYLATASTKQSYMSRSVRSERIVSKTGVVEVVDRNSPNSKVWVWEFENNYEGWKIRSLDLPPVMRYKERYSY